MFAIILFLVILSLLVIIHEFGHFIAAKKFNVKVEEFSFGFPPRVFGIKKGETIFSINLLPIGGFVKLYGEDEAGGGSIVPPQKNDSSYKDAKTAEVFSMSEESIEISDKEIKKEEIELTVIEKLEDKKEDINRALFSKPAWQRAVISVAGVVMNSLLAILIFYVFLVISNFKTELPLIDNHKFFLVNQVNTTDVVISDVAKNSPAQKAGIKAMSKIISVNDQKIVDASQFSKIVNSNKGREITIVFEDLKFSSVSTVKIIPRVSPPKNEGALGIAFFGMSTAQLSYNTLPEKIFSGIIHPLNLLVYNLELLVKIVKISIAEKTAQPLGEGVSGPVGIYSLVGDIVQIPDLKQRVLQMLNLTGLLSMSLAFFNLLPFPALDGGRLFFILTEMVTRRKINPKYEALIHSIGLLILLALLIIITFHDVSKLISGGF